jgi:transposase
MPNAQITIPLDIPDVTVLHTEITERGDAERIITVESTIASTHCRVCGREISKMHGHDNWVTARHLSILGRPTFLRYRPKRYQCEDCDGKPTTTQRLTWHESNSPHTLAYDKHVLLQLVNATIQDVSIKEGLTYDAVLGVLERRMATQVDWTQYTALGTLGLDEIALKKEHGDFVVIVTARLVDERVAGRILAVLANREKETVKAFLETIPTSLRQTIDTVCSDMYDGYIQAACEILSGVCVVVDRFHVARAYRNAADVVRKQELKRLKHDLPVAEYKQLKGSLWAFRKNADDLQPDEQIVLVRLFAHSPNLQMAYTLREALTAIFEQPLSKTEAGIHLRAWQEQVRQSGMTCFDDFLCTLDRWFDEITNYFVSRRNSGFVEELNNKLKVLKRRCYGLFNLNHFFQRISLDLSGYRLLTS